MSNLLELCPEMIGLREAAARTGLSYSYLRLACLRGELVHVRSGKKFLVNFGKLVEYLDTAGKEEEEE